MRAIVAFHLRLTKPAQRRRVTAALRDIAITISPVWGVPRASAFDLPPRDQQSQGAVCCTTCRDSEGATNHDEARTRCIQDASKTLTNGAYMWRGGELFGRALEALQRVR